MTADAPGAARSGSAPITLAAMTLSACMILVDQTAVPLATADAIADLGGAVAEGQWILTANILPLAALMVLGGRLGDLLGLRRRGWHPAPVWRVIWRCRGSESVI